MAAQLLILSIHGGLKCASVVSITSQGEGVA